MDTVTDVKTCQHCGSQAPAERTYCPDCRRKMTPNSTAAARPSGPRPAAPRASTEVIDLRDGGEVAEPAPTEPAGARRGLFRRLLGRR